MGTGCKSGGESIRFVAKKNLNKKIFEQKIKFFFSKTAKTIIKKLFILKFFNFSR